MNEQRERPIIDCPECDGTLQSALPAVWWCSRCGRPVRVVGGGIR